MKITKTVRDIYNDKKERAEFLKTFVDPKMSQICIENKWMYESRIKNEVSFALKLETGRDAYEDFFACRVIVINQKDIESAKEKIISAGFQILKCKPESPIKTNLDPETFSFNDTRLYAKYEQKKNVPSRDFLNEIFEIQIIPLFSYVWAKTTHDLIYKNDDISWGKSRIAFQIKAILEQAQYAIDTIDLTEEKYFPSHSKYEKQKDVINFLKEQWEDRLPEDLIRLSDNVIKFLNKINSSVEEFKEIIKKQNEQNKGAKLLNISPYQSIIQAYAAEKPEKFIQLTENNIGKFKIVITEEINIDENLINELKDKHIIIDYRKMKND